MRSFAKALNYTPNYSKLIEWARLILLTGVGQLTVQAFGFLCGIITVRLMTKQEYALYTLANTMLGTMTMITDCGVANGVMAEGGKVWQNKKKLGIVLATGLNIRRNFAKISLLISLPILNYLLIKNGSGWLNVCWITISIIPAFFAALSDSLLEIAPRLHQDIKRLQRNQSEVSFGRLVLTGLLLFFFPFTAIALIATGFPRVYGNLKLRKISTDYADINENVDPLIKKSIMIGVKRTLPIMIYYCLSAQLSIWLISLFGTSTGISQLGALGRLSVIFTLVSSLFSMLIIPRFSRMNSSNGLLKHFLLIHGIALFVCLCLLSVIWLSSDQILWVLGKNYYGLNYELLLLGISNSIGLILGVSSQLVLSRGWFIKPYYLIVLNISSLVLSICLFNMTSLVGVLYFNIVDIIFHFLLVFIYGLIKIRAN